MSRRVHVLAQDQAVLEREHVDPVPLEPPPFPVGRRRRPLADDEPVSRVETTPAERRRSGQLAKIRPMWSPTSAPSARSPAVWFSNTIPGAWKETIASRSCAFQASL